MCVAAKVCVLNLSVARPGVRVAVQGASPPVRLFPIYFPIGNLATGFFVIFALITGVVGISTSLTGLHDVGQGFPANMMSAAAASLVTWTLTLLAMGLACKEISVSWRPASLVTINQHESTRGIFLMCPLLLCDMYAFALCLCCAENLGGVHHRRVRDAAALRRVAPRRRARGHPRHSHRRQGLMVAGRLRRW